MSKGHIEKDDLLAITWKHIAKISERHLNIDDVYQLIFKQLNFV